MGTVIKGFPPQLEGALIGEAEGQSDFAHLLLAAVVTFTPVGIYYQVVCGRFACVSNCVRGSMCIYFEWKKTKKRYWVN